MPMMSERKSWVKTFRPIPRTTLISRRKKALLRNLEATLHETQLVTARGQQPYEAVPLSFGSSAAFPSEQQDNGLEINSQRSRESTEAITIGDDSINAATGQESSSSFSNQHQENAPDVNTERDTESSETNCFEEEFIEEVNVSNLPTLCSHTECTENDVVLMCLAIVFRHKLTWEAMVDILKMVNAIFEGDGKKKKIRFSKWSIFKKVLNKDQSFDVSYHVYCPDCLAYIGKADSLKVSFECQNCDKTFMVSKEPTYFASLSFEAQLKKLMANTALAEKILHFRFNRSKEVAENLEDIYDGSEYRKLSAPDGILSKRENFSYTFFTDGVALGKMNNRKKTLWPIYVTINELPPKDRSKEMLLVGLYYGSCDPNQNAFLKPFVDEANKLSSVGFEWHHNGNLVSSKVIPLVSVVDSVARPQLLNFQSFHAFYGCTFCYNVSTHTTKRLKFTISDRPVKERTQELYKRDLQQVYKRRFENKDEKRQYKGVKGITFLAKLNYFNLFTGFVVDYMHCLLLGVCDTYFELIFSDTRSKFWAFLDDTTIYTMADVKSVIDERMKSIQPPSSISRVNRSIKDCGSWKASEWRSWLLFYSIPCLMGLLKSEYLEHFAMLSKATNSLLQRSISRSDVVEAHNLFLKFSFLFQKYFGPEHMYLNIHLLKHICKGVLRWGPMAGHNAFMYEAKNRDIANLCKNPYRVVQEVCNKYSILKDLPSLCNTMASTDITLFYCEKVLEKALLHFTRCDSCILLGKGKKIDLLKKEEDILLMNGLCASQCLFFDRLLLKGMRLTTQSCTSTKRNDCVVMLRNGQIVELTAICLTTENKVTLLGEEILLCEESIWASQNVTIHHVFRKEGSGDLKCIVPSFVVGQCVKIDSLTGTFYSKMPLGCYGD